MQSAERPGSPLQAVRPAPNSTSRQGVNSRVEVSSIFLYLVVSKKQNKSNLDKKWVEMKTTNNNLQQVKYFQKNTPSAPPVTLRNRTAPWSISPLDVCHE
ncbi:hypothetical protein F2P81_008661 [Scophthalmus maximus]|uniref:Uncharacterized protein n=1 Tax=Scophthalmus maximus TaxID=52904 RepID=A0A6A4SX82_SCOMX|nr:hypothetical protein F2P81_008661 [Scophthalmus maximus]